MLFDAYRLHILNYLKLNIHVVIVVVVLVPSFLSLDFNFVPSVYCKLLHTLVGIMFRSLLFGILVGSCTSFSYTVLVCR